MFESSLVMRRRSRRWGWKLGLAVLIHAGVATAVVLASAWSVRPVAPPELEEVLYVPLPPPPLGDDAPVPKPPAPAPHPRTETPPAPLPQSQPPRPPETQPTDVPTTTPVPPSAPPADEATSSDAKPGPATSGPGVPWGDPNVTAGDDTPIDISVGMTRPEAIFKVTPAYTEPARIARIQGVVVVRATIDREGRVIDAQVLKPLGFGLDQSAVAAVQQWRFRPATLNGRPVPVYFQLSVTFSVR